MNQQRFDSIWPFPAQDVSLRSSFVLWVLSQLSHWPAFKTTELQHWKIHDCHFAPAQLRLPVCVCAREQNSKNLECSGLNSKDFFKRIRKFSTLPMATNEYAESLNVNHLRFGSHLICLAKERAEVNLMTCTRHVYLGTIGVLCLKWAICKQEQFRIGRTLWYCIKLLDSKPSLNSNHLPTCSFETHRSINNLWTPGRLHAFSKHFRLPLLPLDPLSGCRRQLPAWIACGSTWMHPWHWDTEPKSKNHPNKWRLLNLHRYVPGIILYHS